MKQASPVAIKGREVLIVKRKKRKRNFVVIRISACNWRVCLAAPDIDPGLDIRPEMGPRLGWQLDRAFAGNHCLAIHDNHVPTGLESGRPLWIRLGLAGPGRHARHHEVGPGRPQSSRRVLWFATYGRLAYSIWNASTKGGGSSAGAERTGAARRSARQGHPHRRRVPG